MLQTTERRTQQRWPHHARCRVAIDGRLATLLDIGPGGARIESGYRPDPNSVISVDLPWQAVVHATVLESDPGLRIVFSQPIEDPI